MNGRFDAFFYRNRLTVQLGRWYYRLMRLICRARGHVRIDEPTYIATVCGKPLLMHPWYCARCGEGEL